ncbi:unnamed protein product [Phaedon cochleariae]|uniref:Acyltransferase 3 domain-containing protein n=1 Tax=Phaedon cochleariae TaxID=80249 RepID=A0A9P0GVW2_PHACE|nr:unnamed protein product [Phaedon cochleariae]
MLRYFFVIVLVINKCNGEVSDKEYARMPPVFYQDNFDRCMLLQEEALYCSFLYQLEPLDISNVTDLWKIIKEVSSDNFNYRHDHLRHWICIPFTCPNIDYLSENNSDLEKGVQECYDEKFHSLGLKGKIQDLKCETTESKYPVDWLDILVCIILVLYICLIIYSTFFEYTASYMTVEKYEQLTKTKWGRIFSAFSIPRNWRRLITVKNTPEVETFKPIQGVRFYNTILVILSHTAMSFVLGPVLNTQYTETMNQKVANLFLSSGPLCVSTFFLISSFLLVYGIFSKYEKSELKFEHMLVMFLNRLIRLLPALTVIIIFQATWWRHLGNGPNWWNIVGKEYLNCRKNWWTNLIFLNTVIDRTNMCLVPTWYLALDIQYFGLLLLTIWVLKKYEKFVWWILGTLLGLNMVATFITNYVNNNEALMIPRPESTYEMKIILDNPQWHTQLTSFIGNTAGGIIGLGFGYFYYKTKGKTIFKNTLWTNIVILFLSYVPALSVILLPGAYVLMAQGHHDVFWASIHVAIGRPIFAFCIALAILGAMNGIGWLSRSVMMWSPAYLLGRLAYCAYLLHATLILSRPATSRQPVYISDYSIIYHLFGDFGMSYALSLVMVLLFEMPISDLQKLLMSVDKDSENHRKEK